MGVMLENNPAMIGLLCASGDKSPPFLTPPLVGQGTVILVLTQSLLNFVMAFKFPSIFVFNINV